MSSIVSFLLSLFRPVAERVTLSLIHRVLHKLAMLLRANIPIIQCVELLEKSEQSLIIKKLLYFSKKELYSGKKISESFLYFSDYVEPMFFHLLRIGEETGKLIVAVEQLVTHLSKQIQFQRKMQQALFYPGIILLLALLLFFSLLIFVIPAFAEMFAESHLNLPLYTRVIFSVACFLKSNLLYVLLVVTMLAILISKARLSTSLRAMMFNRFASSRLTKVYREKRYLAEFCGQLATCLSAGLPLTDALGLFQLYGLYSEYQMISELIRRIKTGVAFSHAMEAHAYFPLFMVEMIRIGETSGNLENMLLYLAHYYQEDVDNFLMKLKILIEPLIICMLGVLIGCLVVSIYLPIFKLGSLWQ